jgi:signal transduction histidine kinase
VVTIAGLTRVLKKRLGRAGFEKNTYNILNQLGRSSDSMETFLKDLLDGLAAESTQPNLSPTRLHEAVEEAINRHRGSIDKKGVSIHVAISESLPAVLADERRLLQVLDNLLVNAIRYMGPASNPAIHINAYEEGIFVVIRVSDNGRGIAKEFQKRIFDRFFRVPGSGVSGGTGLGLSIVKKIVESHGGRIWVESGEGRGSTFSFTLPKCQPAEE